MSCILVEGWLEWLRVGNCSEGTIRIRRSALRIFADHHDPMTASGLDIQHYLSALPGGPYSRQGHLSALRSFYKWLHHSGYRDDNPALLLRPISVPDGLPKPVPNQRLHDAVRANADDEIVSRMLILGGWEGLRRDEIARFHESWLIGNEIHVLGKGGRSRRVPIHPRLEPLLNFTGYAFPSTRGRRHIHHETVANYVARALGEPWTTHSLRHRAATEWYRATKDIRAVQKLLGHAHVSTTQRYVMVDDTALQSTVLAVP